MKILHSADWHVGRKMRGRDRSEEHRSVLAEIVAVASEHQVDLTIVAGDVFDNGSPVATSEEIVWNTLLSLAEVSPVVVVAGNHDNPQRLDAVAPLLAMGRVTALGSPRGPDRGGLVNVGGAAVALLPFLSQRSIVKAEDIMGSDPDQNAGLYEERLRRVVARLTDGMTVETVNILVGHLTVVGAQTGGGERDAHIFGYAIPAGVFPGHLSYVALGHLHRQQRLPHPGAVWYSGSPLQLDFGEVDDRKGVLLVEAEPGRPSQVTEVPLITGKRLVTIRGSLEQVLESASGLEGAYVKVILTESARVGLADEVRAAIPDAVDIVLESPATRDAKAAEPRQRLEPLVAFRRYLESEGVVDPEIETLFAGLLAEAVEV
jgi:exonuclease SbcD